MLGIGIHEELCWECAGVGALRVGVEFRILSLTESDSGHWHGHEACSWESFARLDYEGLSGMISAGLGYAGFSCMIRRILFL